MCQLLFSISIFRIGKLKLFHLNQSKSFVHTSPNREIIHCDLPNVVMSQVKKIYFQSSIVIETWGYPLDQWWRDPWGCVHSPPGKPHSPCWWHEWGLREGGCRACPSLPLSWRWFSIISPLKIYLLILPLPGCRHPGKMGEVGINRASNHLGRHCQKECDVTNLDFWIELDECL